MSDDVPQNADNAAEPEVLEREKRRSREGQRKGRSQLGEKCGLVDRRGRSIV